SHDWNVDAGFSESLAGRHAAQKGAGIALADPTQADARPVRVLLRMPAPAGLHLVRQIIQPRRHRRRHFEAALYISRDARVSDPDSAGDHFDQQDGQTPGRAAVESLAQNGLRRGDLGRDSLLPAGQSRHANSAGLRSRVGRLARLSRFEQIHAFIDRAPSGQDAGDKILIRGTAQTSFSASVSIATGIPASYSYILSRGSGD